MDQHYGLDAVWICSDTGNTIVKYKDVLKHAILLVWM